MGVPKLGPHVPAALRCFASLLLASFRKCFETFISSHLSVGQGLAVLILIAREVRYNFGPTSKALVRPYYRLMSATGQPQSHDNSHKMDSVGTYLIDSGLNCSDIECICRDCCNIMQPSQQVRRPIV